MNKLLIVTNSYPNHGGQATTAYNLLKLLRHEQYDVRLVFINNSRESDTDPEKTGVSHKILIKKNIINRIYSWAKKNKAIAGSRQVNALKNYYFFARVIPKLLRFLFSNKFSPDLVITNIPSYYWIIKKIFGKKKVLVIIGSSPEMNKLSAIGVDATALINKPGVISQIPGKTGNYDFSGMNVLFNSSLTKQVYDSLKIPTGRSFVQYFNIVPVDKMKPVDFDQRKYDIAFVASDFSRKIKNAELAETIFKAFPNHKKIAIGIGNGVFSNVDNVELAGFTTQKEIIAILCNTKLLVITSFFDSSPSVLSEAILHGCNVLISKNIGWSEMIGEQSVVGNYADTNEWVSKAKSLIASQISYPAFEGVIKNSGKQIVKNIQDVLSDGR